MSVDPEALRAEWTAGIKRLAQAETERKARDKTNEMDRIRGNLHTLVMQHVKSASTQARLELSADPSLCSLEEFRLICEAYPKILGAVTMRGDKPSDVPSWNNTYCVVFQPDPFDG